MPFVWCIKILTDYDYPNMAEMSII